MRISQLSRGVMLASLVALFLVAVGLNKAFSNLRIDLTEQQLYTLSDGMRNLLSKLDEPINLYLFFSEKHTRDQTHLRNYHQRVLDVLNEYRLYADGKLILHTVNPEPFSEEEDRATQFGIQAVRRADGNSIYFGIAGTNAFGEVEKIPFLQPNREILLEYELGQLIYALSRTDKVVVGLMTTLDMMQTRMNPATGTMNPPWVITEQLEQLFDVRLVLIDAETIDPEIDVLVVVHPKGLTEKTEYAIDQFILNGGKGLFFVDPYADSEFLPQTPGQPPPSADAKSSNLNKLFRAWGFEVDERNVVGDASYALSVSLGDGRQLRHLAMLGVPSGMLNQEDVITQGLKDINFAMASHITAAADSSAEVTPLIQSSKRSALISLERLRFLGSPQILEQGFTPNDETYTLAARVKGKFKSAFSEPPEGAPTDISHLAEAVDEANLIVVADSDVLTDRMWAQVRSFFGQNLVQAFAGNRDFMINATDNLTGSNDLIGIRSRSGFARPFTRVQAIEEAAERQFKDTERRLNEELQRTEQRLQQLQQKRSDADANTLLTPEQQAEIQKFRLEQIETRKKLRQVRHSQTADIESLGATLKMINIGAVPLVVVVIALILGVLRVRRRNAVMN